MSPKVGHALNEFYKEDRLLEFLPSSLSILHTNLAGYDNFLYYLVNLYCY